MFGKRSKEEPTTFERQKGLNINQLFCFGALGVLIYSFIQGLVDESKTPTWFIIVMPILILATIVILLYNFREIKKLKKYIAEMEEESRLEEEKSVLNVDELTDTVGENTKVSKYDE